MNAEDLNSKQTQAFTAMTRMPKENFFVTGIAGAGKSYLVKKVVKELKQRGKRVRIAAPTGIAAQQVGGITIAKLLGLRLAKRMSDLPMVQFDQAEQNLLGVDVVSLDEISMVSGDQLQLIDHVMREATGRDDPFGGIQIIFCGDFLQLPTIQKVGQEEPLEMPWAFEYPAFRKVLSVYLDESMRQTDPDEVKALNEFRHGLITELGLEYLCAMASRHIDDPIHLYPRRDAVNEINSERLSRLPGPETVYETIYSPPEWKKGLSAQVPVGEQVAIKLGAPVVILENDPSGRFVNGSQGKVEKIYSDAVWVRLRNNRLVEVREKTWEIYGGNHEVIATVKGMPLHLGWAITIHRAQGMTLDAVALDLRNCWEAGQAYVALSRTRSLRHISLTCVPDKIIVDPVAKAFMEKLG